MKEHYFVAQTEITSHFLTRTLRGVRCKKIMDDFHWTVEAEHLLGLSFQEFGNSGHRVRVGQRVVDSRAVTWIVTKQRGVGAMKGGDHARLLLCQQHRTGQDRRGGMGYSIVNVKNVELVITAHFRHLYRERQCIVGILEQSVVVDHHRVKKKS